jgi:ABC-type antimicrobial peptide transport system permease subunit
VRTQGSDPLSLASTVRSQVLAIDPDQAVSDVHTMEDVIQESVGQRRLTMVLTATFASVALLLAVVGIYGLVSYSVAQRTQEVGVRRVLGAQQGDVLRLVLGEGVALALVGVPVGTLGALALTRVMKEFLFQVSTTDHLTFVGIPLLFTLVVLAAGFLPAKRAIRVDPMVALRYE